MIIQNLSITNPLTINTSDNSFLVTLPPWNQIRLVLDSNGTAPGTWSYFITPLETPAVTNAASLQLTQNVSYLLLNTGSVTVSLPSAANVGDFIEISDGGGSTFTITQNAGQRICFGTSVTTITSGTIVAQNIYASLKLVCVAQNTDFMVLSPDGNFNTT